MVKKFLPRVYTLGVISKTKKFLAHGAAAGAAAGAPFSSSIIF